MDDERARALDRIKRLRERTTARGCTEAEAMAAAEKAAEMMAAHGYHDGDVEFDEATAKASTGGKSARLNLWAEIGHCTSTAILLQPSGSRARGTIRFIGRSPGVEIAAYLAEVCDRALDREIANFRKGTFYKRRRSAATKAAAVHDFTMGMVARMSTRLRKLFPLGNWDTAARKAARDERDRRFPRAGKVSPAQRDPRFHEASMAGYSAGGRVTLAHGVNGGAEQRLIGSGA